MAIRRADEGLAPRLNGDAEMTRPSLRSLSVGSARAAKLKELKPQDA